MQVPVFTWAASINFPLKQKFHCGPLTPIFLYDTHCDYPLLSKKLFFWQSKMFLPTHWQQCLKCRFYKFCLTISAFFLVSFLKFWFLLLVLFKLQEAILNLKEGKGRQTLLIPFGKTNKQTPKFCIFSVCIKFKIYFTFLLKSSLYFLWKLSRKMP